MRVVVAPDKFKGSLPAAAVAAHLAAGLRAARPSLEVVEIPVADGGEGTLAAAASAGFAPTGEYARRGETAVVELAAVCGVAAQAGSSDPMTASSYRVGEVLRAALRDGTRRIVLGLGGSTSTDGGAGMLSALGARVLDEAGTSVAPGGGGLVRVAALDLTSLDPAVQTAEIVLASDVDNPLYGTHGAAYVYAPQKGASPDEVRVLDDALRRWADVVSAAVGADHANDAGAGAAGGVGFAALAVLGATRRPGIEVVLELVDFDRQLAEADLVITGEGTLDEQTLAGKAPSGVAAAARRAGVPVIAVCGRNEFGESSLFDAVFALSDLAPLEVCLAQPGPLLEQLGTQILNRFPAWQPRP
jgi:glycerate kinase